MIELTLEESTEIQRLLWVAWYSRDAQLAVPPMTLEMREEMSGFKTSRELAERDRNLAFTLAVKIGEKITEKIKS